jgi:hypothetical protein
VAIDAYYAQPLRMGTLRVSLSTNAGGNLVVTATNQTHVPLIVPLDALTLGLAPTPDWIPETMPGIRWVPNPALSLGLLVVGPDETVTITLAMPASPPASAAAYKSTMATLYAGIADGYPGATTSRSVFLWRGASRGGTCRSSCRSVGVWLGVRRPRPRCRLAADAGKHRPVLRVVDEERTLAVRSSWFCSIGRRRHNSDPQAALLYPPLGANSARSSSA